MPEDVQPVAAPSVAPVALVADAPAPQFDMDTMSAEERRANFAKGVLPKRLPKPEAKPSVPPTESTSAAVPTEETPAGTAPDSDHGDEEEPTNETPEEKKRRHRSLREEVKRVSREYERAQGELKALREQIAAKPTPAPAPAKAPASANGSELKKPRINDYPATPEGTAQWEDDIETYYDKKADLREAKQRESQSLREKTTTIESRIKEAKAKYSDFEDLVLNPTKSAAASHAMLETLKARPDGMDLAYHLAKNPDESTRIFKLTEAKGPKSEARAELEFDLLAERLANPPKPPAEKKITSAPPPPKAVSGNGGGTADPLKTAQEIGQRTGNWEPFNKLMNERKMAKRGIVSK